MEESIEYKDEVMFRSFKLCKSKKIKDRKSKNPKFSKESLPVEASFTIEEVEDRIKTFQDRLMYKPEESKKLSKQILFERAKIEVLR